MGKDKKIALVAHDRKKRDLVEWAKYNRDLLAHHKIYATRTTGALLEKELGFSIIRLQSGPLGCGEEISLTISNPPEPGCEGSYNRNTWSCAS